MANKKFYTVEKEYKGKKYVAQFSGISVALEGLDSSYVDGTSNVSMKKMGDYVFKNIIVEPKNLTADDFANTKDFNEVVSWAMDVMNGNFQPETEK